MKKTSLLLILAVSGAMVSAQKKNNGSIYIEHPAINVVTEFEKATVSGDSAKIAGFLTDDFKSYNGTTADLSLPSTNRTAYLNNILRYSRELDYFAIEPIPGSYPDALEYAKDNKDGDIVVQNWILLKGVHRVTGVKLDAAAQRIYYVTKANKIKRIINYSNSKVIDEIFASYSDRTNGKIYNHHENINAIRKAVYALEKGEVDKYLSFFSDEAKFYDINDDWETSRSKADEKTNIENFLKAFEIKSVDMIGYPDYLEYEMDAGREVLSWWKFNLVRKSDKKAIVLPMHLSHGFDDKGEIISEIGYYSSELLKK